MFKYVSCRNAPSAKPPLRIELQYSQATRPLRWPWEASALSPAFSNTFVLSCAWYWSADAERVLFGVEDEYCPSHEGYHSIASSESRELLLGGWQSPRVLPPQLVSMPPSYVANHVGLYVASGQSPEARQHASTRLGAGLRTQDSLPEQHSRPRNGVAPVL